MGTDNRSYGRHYVCAVRTIGDDFKLIVTDRNAETVLAETDYELAPFGWDKEQFEADEHEMELHINATALEVLIDDKRIVQQQLDAAGGIGENIGFWTTRGAFYAYYDDLQIVDENDNVVWMEDFEKPENIFSPYYCKTDNGWLKVDAGYLLTLGGERPAPMFRKEFQAEEISSARLYASALGVYNLYINGQRVSDEYCLSDGTLWEVQTAL